MKHVENNSDKSTERRKYSKLELDCATDFVAGLIYPLWIKSRKNEIMKLDKTIYDNEEPNNIS